MTTPVLKQNTSCRRGEVTTILLPVEQNATYVVYNHTREPNKVGYWGSVFEEYGDAATTLFPYQVVRSTSLYRTGWRITTSGYGSQFYGSLRLWIPRQNSEEYSSVSVYQYPAT